MKDKESSNLNEDTTESPEFEVVDVGFDEEETNNEAISNNTTSGKENPKRKSTSYLKFKI